MLNKPCGLLTVRAKFAGHEDCLESRVKQGFPSARVVHRLDMDTSGLIVMALTDQAQRHLGRQFEQKRAQKTYVGLVQGLVAAETGLINLPLANDRENMPKQMVCFDTGRPSQTKWRVLDREAGQTRLALTPITGRSHQLRVHLAACGHPILGDRFYGETAGDAQRLMLHATTLRIRHPQGNAFVEYESQCPF